MDTKFYEFTQNNSGGDFVVDNHLTHRVFIEAKNSKEANEIAESMGVYFDGVEAGIDCGCCGDRWYTVDEFDVVDLERIGNSYDITFSTIEEYATLLKERYGMDFCEPDARIFYSNGTITEI